MLLQLMCVIWVFSQCIIRSDSFPNSEINETAAILSIHATLAQLSGEIRLIRLEQDRQKTVLAGMSKNEGRNVEHNLVETYGRDCSEVTATFKHSAIYDIRIPSFSDLPFKVDCDAKTRGGDWTILLRRFDGSVNFYRNWTEYKNGFGNIDGEFFLGLDKIYAITADKRQELMFILEDFQGDVRYELYDEFAIGDELEAYALHTLGTASGTAGDSFAEHRGQKFSTLDRDNDRWERNCAEVYSGAWWYKFCYRSNLTGKYKNDSNGKGVSWFHFRGDNYSLKRAVMMIRPKR